MKTAAATAVVTGVGAASYNPWKAMGQNPVGKRLERVKASAQYVEGSFQNIEHTPMLAEGQSYWDVGRKYLKTVPDREPAQAVPIMVPTWQADAQELEMTWYGHSSYCLRWPGHALVVDPVFHRASPVSWAGPAPYAGMSDFGPEHLPAFINTLLITHDHYDHLDYRTMMAILPRVGRVVCTLGVGQHLEYWGFPVEKITELDWWESTQLDTGISLTAAPARHFSGRGLTRNHTLWASYMLNLGTEKVFIGGDSGYGAHFKTIKEKLGSPDLALMECGQYNEAWRNIHAMPDETAQAAYDLGAAFMVPVHWSKFTLALHPWLEPPTVAQKKAIELGLPIGFPKPGQTTALSALKTQHLAQEKPWFEQFRA